MVSYDSPALVAGLAGSAGQFATNEQQQMMALRQAEAARQSQALAQQAQRDAASASYQRMQLRQRQQESEAARQEQAQGRKNAQEQQRKAGDDAIRQKDDLSRRVRRMESDGYLTPGESARYQAQIETGNNPFNQKPLGETPPDPYKQASYDRAVENDQYTRERDQKNDAQRIIRDEIDALEKRLNDPGSYLSDEEKAALATAIAAKRREQLKYITPAAAPAPPRMKLEWQGNQLVQVPDPAAPPPPLPSVQAAPSDSAALKPIPRSMVSQFILQAGGDPQLAMELARRAGYDPDSLAEGQ